MAAIKSLTNKDAVVAAGLQERGRRPDEGGERIAVGIREDHFCVHWIGYRDRSYGRKAALRRLQ